MFMHGGYLHLGGMLYLWIFGDNIEDSTGHFRYAVFYLLCGVAAALAQAFVDPPSELPMVGASSAISGVLGAYILLHPHATVRVFIFLGVFVTVTHIPR
jgi:membrane associated rhomboid family serine protease